MNLREESVKQTRIKMNNRAIAQVMLEVLVSTIVEKKGTYEGLTTPILTFVFREKDNPNATIEHVEYGIKHVYSTNNPDDTKAGRNKTAEELNSAVVLLLNKITTIHNACITNPRHKTLLAAYNNVLKSFEIKDNYTAEEWIADCTKLYVAIAEFMKCTQGIVFDFLPDYEISSFVGEQGGTITFVKAVMPRFQSPVWLAKTGTGSLRARNKTYDMWLAEIGSNASAFESDRLPENSVLNGAIDDLPF